MNRFFRYATFVSLPLVFLLPLAAQAPLPQPDPGISRQQADDILNELRQIRQLLERQAQGQAQAQAQQAPTKPARAKLNLTGAQMLGSKDAPITIVEFTDYQCPFCQRFHSATYPELKKNFIDNGKVRFYSRDLPLDSLHPNAFRAAQSGRCAADQGQFWKMREVMALNPDKLDMDSLIGYAQDLKLDVPVFRSCIETEKYKSAVQSDVLEAMRVGADGTPAFVIGKSTPDGVDGELLVGAQPLPEFVRAIARAEGK